MADVGFAVRRIAAGDGALLREIRLAAIADSPGVFATTLEEARNREMHHWERVAEASSVGTDQATWFAQAEQDDGSVETAGMFSAYRTVDDVVTLNNLWSAPGYRDIGVADALVAAATQWARDSGGVQLRLWVVERNEYARRFYEHLGFIATGAEMAYEPDPNLIEFELRKPLDPD